MNRFKISATDTVFVSAVQYGKMVLEPVAITGMGSIGELMNRVRDMIGRLPGIVMVTLRNMNCGWRTSQAVRTGRSVGMFASVASL